jgi:hypothetical protein
MRRRLFPCFSALLLLLCTAVTARAFVNVDFEGYKPRPEVPALPPGFPWLFAVTAIVVVALSLWSVRCVPAVRRLVVTICWIASLGVCFLTTAFWPASYWQTFCGAWEGRVGSKTVELELCIAQGRISFKLNDQEIVPGSVVEFAGFGTGIFAVSTPRPRWFRYSLGDFSIESYSGQPPYGTHGDSMAFAESGGRFLGVHARHVAANWGRTTAVSTPLPYVTLLMAALPVVAIRRRIREARRDRIGRCPQCGYDLRATPDRCPECGAAREAP